MNKAIGYARMFEILSHIKNPISIRALAVCSGLPETKVIFILMRNMSDLKITLRNEMIYTEEMQNEKSAYSSI